MLNLRDRLKGKRLRGALMLLGALAAAGVAAGSFLDHRRPLPIKAGPGVTEIRHLRDYFQAADGDPRGFRGLRARGKAARGRRLDPRRDASE